MRTLINTHHHGDHSYGNFLFSGATIVGHEARTGILDWGPPRSAPFWAEVEWGGVVVEPPFLTYTDSVTLWADDLRADVRYVGVPAHTTNDSIAWLPERKLLFCGDGCSTVAHRLSRTDPWPGAIRVLEEVVRPLGAQTIVPGHVAGPDLIDDVLGYLRFVQPSTRAGREAGLTPLAAARELDLGQYADLLDPERIVGNLHRAYAELDGGPLGRPIDAVAVLGEMVAYNGGRPLSCLA